MLEKLKRNQSIVIKIADKGGAIVVMDRSEYTELTKKDLNNSKYYTKLEHDNIQDFISEKHKLVEDMKGYLDSTEYETLSDNSNMSTPIFYALPKIHKTFMKLPPLKPIVAGYQSATVKLFEYVDSFLKPIARKCSSYVRDTTHFLNRLRSLKGIPNDALMAVMDVHGLYNNIDQEEGVEACFNALEKRKKKNVPLETIKTLILFILKNSVFRFSNTFYQQIMGTIMGSPIAPNFANLFMSEVEMRLINDYETKSGLRSLIWLRYIDNIFFLWSHDQESLDDFISFICSYSKSRNMKSTFDYDVRYSQDEVDFLNCKVRIRNGQFHTELYTKDTDAHLYLLSSSCHPKHTINTIPKGQFIRIRRICSDLELYWKHAKEYIKFFAERGYNLQKLQDVAKEISKVD